MKHRNPSSLLRCTYLIFSDVQQFSTRNLLASSWYFLVLLKVYSLVRLFGRSANSKFYGSRSEMNCAGGVKDVAFTCRSGRLHVVTPSMKRNPMPEPPSGHRREN